MDDTMMDTWPPYITAQGVTELLEKKKTNTKKPTNPPTAAFTAPFWKKLARSIKVL